MKDSLVILSGGMDSTTVLYHELHRVGQAVSFNYGSKHNDSEIKHARLTCEKLNIPHIVIDLESAFKHFNSALLNPDHAIPEGHYEEETMKATVVPFRNGIMLSVAAGLAESLGLAYIVLGNHAGDHAVYPDCRADFIAQMNGAILMGTGGMVHIRAPFTQITKQEIAELGAKLGVPWVDTYSCYKGGKYHCGRCSTCVERIWALRYLGDPTLYVDPNFAMKLLQERGEWL